MRRQRTVRRLAAAACCAAIAAAAACGGSDGGTTTPTQTITCATLPDAKTILIANNAVCPQALTVARGTQVTFINNDGRPHEMYSDPHPEHTDCTELNQVGHLEPGQRRDTGNLVTPRRCGFHDHLNFENRALQGTITIQ
jgi:plastocyanin